MTPLRRTVDVIMERIPLSSRWASERWQPAAIEVVTSPDGARAVATTPGEHQSDADGADANRWRCRGFDVELHTTESEGYYLNITAPDPKIFVMWRFFDDGEPKARPVLVTLSYNEAGRFMDAGEQVDGVPMVPAIADWMREFVAANYRPEPRRKVRRNDPLSNDASASASRTPPRGTPPR